jgi:hypothetical protein
MGHSRCLVNGERFIELFFADNTDEATRTSILEKYKVDYVYGTKAELPFIMGLPHVQLEFESGDLVLCRITRY